MKFFQVLSSTEDGYDVHVENGLMKNIVEIIRKSKLDIGDTVYIVTDDNVANLYLSDISVCFTMFDIRTEIVVVPAGEEHKSFETYEFLIDKLLQKGIMRRSLLILIGGGMIMDLGGFVGATIMRGIPVINIPTSLVAQVDAAIGGKVAINHKSAKNLIGNFYNPKLVCIDPTFLLTLDDSQIQEGLAEAIKVAIINSPDLFHLIETQKTNIFSRNLDLFERIIELSVSAKIELLKPDPLEVNLERALNFGHTLAHPLETLYHYKGLTHGKAVALGMSAASVYAVHNGYLTAEVSARIENVIKSVGLPTSIKIENRTALFEALNFIIKVRNGNLNLVLPVEIGKALILPQADLVELIDCLAERL
jgi:3-dehydroquinate synthase